MTTSGGRDRLAEVLRRVAVSQRREDGRPAFLDGLVLGAMVGAAIAGSTLWNRWHASRRRRPEPPERDAGG
jgi:hypothetical protein